MRYEVITQFGGTGKESDAKLIALGVVLPMAVGGLLFATSIPLLGSIGVMVGFLYGWRLLFHGMQYLQR